MRKLKLGLVIVLTLCLVMVFAACQGGGGGTDSKLVGEWTGMIDGAEVKWNFEANGKCAMTNFFYEDTPGTYELTVTEESETELTGTVSIKLDIWDEANVYDVVATDSDLSMLAQDPYGPQYEMTK